MKSFAIFVFFFTYSLAFAGDQRARVLERQLYSAADDRKATIFNELCNAFQKQDPAKAVDFGLKGIEIAERFSDVDQLALLHHGVGKAYIKQAHYERAANHLIASLELYEEVDNEYGKAQVIRDMTTDLKLKSRVIEIKNAEIRRQKASKYVLFSIITVLLAAALYFVRKQHLRLRYQLLQKNEKEAELEELRLKKARLQQELDLKARQFTSFTLNFVQKNNLIKSMKEEVESICKKADGSRLIPDLYKLKNKAVQGTSVDREWEHFKLYFEQVHQDFFRCLKGSYPQLTANELRLCALMRLNMSSKEIAAILGISPQSVKMARYRLRKKLCLQPEDDFSGFLFKLEEVEG
ncbi:hypothetical protein C900_00834 [Fulvivirga imtechensis AK7]|uniref:HTH luxR-type domain-containing protein n=1 Tax=Fulvivirga imtechensis AK7 TaxID=1237149 RepID=L8JXG2_9BACT|nr:sigma factor-like helix-turn-helix DNA-binding protein [Fulvivirga imtechensis]ELR72873.1 hypothetical protein C900_00834 [Fulvivirga imtechensis AK7]